MESAVGLTAYFHVFIKLELKNAVFFFYLKIPNVVCIDRGMKHSESKASSLFQCVANVNVTQLKQHLGRG